MQKLVLIKIEKITFEVLHGFITFTINILPENFTFLFNDRITNQHRGKLIRLLQCFENFRKNLSKHEVHENTIW